MKFETEEIISDDNFEQGENHYLIRNHQKTSDNAINEAKLLQVSVFDSRGKFSRMVTVTTSVLTYTTRLSHPELRLRILEIGKSRYGANYPIKAELLVMGGGQPFHPLSPLAFIL